MRIFFLFFRKFLVKMLWFLMKIFCKICFFSNNNVLLSEGYWKIFIVLKFFFVSSRKLYNWLWLQEIIINLRIYSSFSFPFFRCFFFACLRMQRISFHQCGFYRPWRSKKKAFFCCCICFLHKIFGDVLEMNQWNLIVLKIVSKVSRRDIDSTFKSNGDVICTLKIW